MKIMSSNYTLLLTFAFGITLAYILFSKKSYTETLGYNENGIISNYKNNEKWHIIRDENGNLIDIEVIRDAKLTI